MFAIFLAFVLGWSAHAGELAGVKLPDTVQVGGQELVLNGMALREKYFLDVYVGGLYLPTKTSSGDAVISQDVPRRLVMHFTYKVSKNQLTESMTKGVEKGSDKAKSDMSTCTAMFEDVGKGDEITFEYVPDMGTKVVVRGKEKGTISGTDFISALLSIYVGPDADNKLRKGLLSN